jgi:hypothetical protein
MTKKFTLIIGTALCAMSLAVPPAAEAGLKHTNAATASSGAATLNNTSGIITSESLTTAGLADYTLTLTNSYVTTTSFVYCVVWNGTNTQGTVALGTIKPAAGSVVIIVHNLHATQALNGTIKVGFSIL